MQRETGVFMAHLVGGVRDAPKAIPFGAAAGNFRRVVTLE